MTTTPPTKPLHLLSRPSYGWPNVFSPEGCGLVIEDVWPSLYIGAARVPEIARKAEKLPWARAAVETWKAEAELVLREEPHFVAGESGGRCGLYLSDRGHHLIFDPEQCKRMYNPATKEYIEPDEKNLKAWVILSHERIRRLMSSLAFLYRLTGDARYSLWVWTGLRRLVSELYVPERFRSDSRYSAVYDGLYEAQAALQVVQTLELVQGAPGGSDADARAVANVLGVVGEALSRWMDVMIVHNMSCWTMAALAELGRYLGRNDWVQKALYSERAGLQVSLRNGVPLDPKTRKPDGFWHETSTFYHFYACIPLITLYRIGEQAQALDNELHERFRALFEAPLHLVDSDLRLLSVGDRVGPGALNLTQFRHVYEYAAGQVDPERYGPVLSLLYERCGAARNSLAALAWGLDELPAPCEPPQQSTILGGARMVSFRKRTDRGDIVLWFLGGEDNHPGQAHHHHDKLSVSIHAFGQIVTSDLGLPSFSDNVWSTFLDGTLSHNTLLVDECDQGPMASLAFDADLAAAVPWARAAVRGDREGHRASLWKTMLRRGDEVREGVYDDVIIERTVLFDPPYVVLADRCRSEAERRFTFVLHGCGRMVAGAVGADGIPPLALPDLRSDGAWGLFQGRTCANPAKQVTADWHIASGLWLRLVAISDGPFEATWGHTPGNPREQTRGTVLLRAPGKLRRFAAVLELHRGTPSVSGVAMRTEGEVEVVHYHGATRSYTLPLSV